MEKDGADIESGRGPQTTPHWKLVLDQGLISPEVLKWHYDGSGTEEDPYVVTWIDNDPRNPMNFSKVKKWSLTMLVAIATLAVAFVSSAYTGGIRQIITEFGVSSEVVTLGVSLFVLGFAIGPLLWAPLSEIFGRQILYIVTYGALTVFNVGAAGSKNIWTLIILRFFAGSFGSSPLTNAGGVIADMFSASERGLAMSLFSAAPFMGPVLGPIVGGFLGQAEGWRWVEGLMAIFTGSLWLIGTLLIPETYPPVLLRKRAAKLCKMTGKVYRSKGDIDQGPTTLGKVMKTTLSRPWILLFREPIVLLLSIYMAIVYGTLYMLFGAFPVVYQQGRGWSEGIGGLAFLGVAVGMSIAVAYSIFDNKRYLKVADVNGGFAPPEARLPPCMIGGIAFPLGLFWFAWTCQPSIHWLVSIAAGVPMGFGIVLIFLAVMNYLIDSYTIFAASVLAANAVIRSLFGAAFPLFTAQMYANLGIHWASSIPAFLALMCVPFPFLFYKYGPAIRVRCKYAAEADAFLKKMKEGVADTSSSDGETEEEEKEEEKERDEEQEVIDYSFEDQRPRFERIKTARPHADYDYSPYDIDRVNTRDSFQSRSRASSRTRSVKSAKSERSTRR
ncbi:major facilitator superfamily domain-containing protein [Cryomyces antarcticus]